MYCGRLSQHRLTLYCMLRICSLKFTLVSLATNHVAKFVSAASHGSFRAWALLLSLFFIDTPKDRGHGKKIRARPILTLELDFYMQLIPSSPAGMTKESLTDSALSYTTHAFLTVRPWLQLRFDFDSTAIRVRPRDVHLTTYAGTLRLPVRSRCYAAA